MLAVANRGIEEFVKFVLENNLQEKFNTYNQNLGKDFSYYIAESCHKINKELWVPAIANGQIGEFVLFCSKNNLWESFQKIIKFKNN
ncbi:MAG: hypothetical protein V1910_00035 [bacterium]